MGEAGHAVGATGSEKTIGHGAAGLADQSVEKAFRQIEPLRRVRDQGKGAVGAAGAGASGERERRVEQADGLGGAYEISSG